MSKDEMKILIKKNKEEVDVAIKEFEKHSKNFDDKLRKIILAL